MYPTSYAYNYSAYNLSNISLPSLPTIFDIIKQHNPNLVTAVTYNWDWFGNFFESNPNIDHVFKHWNTFDDNTTTNKMIEWINKYQPNLMFNYFGSLDETGHSTFWGSPKYYDTLKNIDRLINKLIEALKHNDMLNKTRIVFIADHGGYNKSHGPMAIHNGFDAANIFIPIIFSGYCINVNMEISDLFVENIDVAPMILDSFGFDVNKLRYMKGRVYNEIYKEQCNSTPHNRTTIETKMSDINYYDIIIIALVIIVFSLLVVIIWIKIKSKHNISGTHIPLQNVNLLPEDSEENDLVVHGNQE